MSRAERAGQVKKMNNSHCPALRRRRRGEAAPLGEAASWLGREKSLYSAFWLISCQPRLGTRPGWLGKLQAVTTHRPNSSSWVGGRVLIVEVMVGGGRPSIWAPAELGPGEMNACVNEGAGWWSSCRNAKGQGWNRCREPRVTCNRKALITASKDVGGSHRKGRSAAEKRGDERWNQCWEQCVSCDLRIGGP
jgi:hypothetical protein